MTHFKKIALLALISVSSVSFAKNYHSYKDHPVYKDRVFKDACPMPPLLHDGFYLGVQGGYDMFKLKQDTTGTDNIFALNPQLSATGWVGGIFVGFGKYFNYLYYLGLEAVGNYSSTDTDYDLNTQGPNTYSTNFTARGSFGISVMPGIAISNTTLGYLRGGYMWTTLKTEENLNGIQVNQSVTDGATVAGLGMETLIVNNWSVRAEYDHISYLSFRANHQSEFVPYDNQFTVGVVYHLF